MCTRNRYDVARVAQIHILQIFMVAVRFRTCIRLRRISELWWSYPGKSRKSKLIIVQRRQLILPQLILWPAIIPNLPSQLLPSKRVPTSADWMPCRSRIWFICGVFVSNYFSANYFECCIALFVLAEHRRVYIFPGDSWKNSKNEST